MNTRNTIVFYRDHPKAEKTKRLVNQIKEYLTELYGEHIKQVILYGSRVRGEALEDSDIDILVLVDESLNPFEVRKSLSNLLFEILLEFTRFVFINSHHLFNLAKFK